MKNLIVGAIVGLAFMAGGFWYGLRLKPLPTPQSQAALIAAALAEVKPPAPPPISLDTLKKTSETMMSLNEALEVREKAVAEREQKVAQREDELGAERTALDASHAKFKDLFSQFQQRLQLVEASESANLQKEADLYTAMGTVQSIDLIRGKEDEAVVKLFSMMDTKPLAKLVSDWKTKYPDDAPRLLHVLDAMATVMPKDKIALTDTPATPDGSGASSPAPTDNSAPAAAPSTDAPAPDSSTPAPAPTPAPPDATPPVAAPTDSTAPAATPATDPSSLPAAPATPSSPQPLAPPADTKPAVSTAASN